MRRRFLLVSVAALAVLAAALGVSFAGNSGTASLGVSSSSTDFIFPAKSTGAVPDGVTALKYTGTPGIDAVNDVFTASVVNPDWAPVKGAAGSVTTAGDLALIDASTATLGDHTALTVSMYITNLDKLQTSYSSFAFPVQVYKCAATCTSGGAWTQASAVLPATGTFVTNTDGFVTFSLAAGQYYVIVFETGGSFYTVSTDTAANLSPAFYFTATPS